MTEPVRFSLYINGRQVALESYAVEIDVGEQLMEDMRKLGVDFLGIISGSTVTVKVQTAPGEEA